MAIINHGSIVAIGTVDELREKIGKVAVESTDPDGKTVISYFPTREDAKGYTDTLGDDYFNVRRTTLEDVFLELTGESRGKLA